MGVFDKVLKSSETLFQNELALDFTFIPPILPFRENQQSYIASCIKPLFNNRSGKNLLISGSPGIGKTVATRHVLKQLSDETEEILPLYVNCWKKNSAFKVLHEICEMLDIKFVESLTTEQLAKKVSSALNKKPAVLCLDEIDKLDQPDILYALSEDILKKSLIFITNEKLWLSSLDARIKSRLTLDVLEFQPYSLHETEEILKQRSQYAFYPRVFNLELLPQIAVAAHQAKDIRTGIYLLKESALLAEEQSSRIITQQHIEGALKKLDNFQTRSKSEIPPNKQPLLEFIKENMNKSTLELYKLYRPKSSYKTFKRKLQDLESAGFIRLELRNDGPGKSTIVSLPLHETLDKF